MTEGVAGVAGVAEEEPVRAAAGPRGCGPASAIRALVVTDTGSETSEYASVQVPAVEEMLQLLQRHGVALDAVDVAGDYEQRFWVVTQTMLSYPPYPQLYIADQRFGTLRGLQPAAGGSGDV